MRWAEARLKESSITRSSIRLSFTGGQVGCTTKTSAPRTFSSIWTKTSPSENRATSACPRASPRMPAISSASWRFALPEKSFSSYGIASPPDPRREPGRAPGARASRSLVGAGGFEPPVRDPKSRALPLGHAPSPARPVPGPPLADDGQRRPRDRPRDPDPPRLPGERPRDPVAGVAGRGHADHGGPAAGHHGGERAGPEQRRLHRSQPRPEPPRRRLQAVHQPGRDRGGAGRQGGRQPPDAT